MDEEDRSIPFNSVFICFIDGETFTSAKQYGERLTLEKEDIMSWVYVVYDKTNF